MSEKRRPEVTFVAEISGKRWRVELFQSTLFDRRNLVGVRGPPSMDLYRLRVNGKWYGTEYRDENGNDAVTTWRTFTLSQVMQLIRRSMIKARKAARRKS